MPTAHVVDPVRVGRARDLLERAEVLVAVADRTPVGEIDDTERFRQYYLAALRGAGAALAIAEPVRRTRRAQREDAWSRIEAYVPVLSEYAQVFTAESRIRARIEAGLLRALPPGRVAELRVNVLALLDAAEMAIVAYEQGHSKPAGVDNVYQPAGYGGRGSDHLVS